MKEEELKRLFGEASQQNPDPEKRRQAIEAAKAEFLALSQGDSQKSENTSQGNDDSVRPIANIFSLSRREKMSQISQRWLYSGIASAAVIVLAVSILFSSLLVPTKLVRPDEAETVAEINSASLPELLEMVTEGEMTRAYDEREQEAEFANYRAATSKMAKPQHQLNNNALVRDSSVSIEVENRDNFQQFETNPVKSVKEEPVSTFSIDVDTASYSFVRKQLNQGVLPSKASVRLEELVNYFPYDYPTPRELSKPFLPTVSILPSPWNSANRLVHIGIKGYELPDTTTMRSNLVFLLDVSGSMSQPDKLPLVKQSMSLLLSQLHPEDTVAIVVYAGVAGTILEPTPVSEKQKILSAMNRLSAGGSTAGAEGIKLAYQLAESSFVEGGVNRVFLATDGDFNVGITNQEDLKGFIERKRDSGIYLSILGFGQGNYQDALMQQLAQNGNGIAAHIDTLAEAQKVLVEEAQSQLFPIANDVKIQVEFNPTTVSEYRLLGYETRSLKREDFNNDKVDAGEIGAGHSVTAIYEITPRGSEGLLGESRYESKSAESNSVGEYGFLKIRYKNLGEKTSQLISQPISVALNPGTDDTRFAVAVAGFAQLLKDGRYTGEWNLEDALQLALDNKGQDIYGYRSEFTQLIRKAMVADEIR
ncbi:MAG: Ca-activated chloride channel family protein [Candidatus Azotimanducaceae bacterium]|jgi:Ca-activated chloride channel family protein